MKYLIRLFFFVVAGGIVSCAEQNPDLSDTGQLNPLPDTFILNNYTQDAKNLYYKEILSDSSHFNFYNPKLDTTEIVKILEIIQAVYELNSPESDTVFHYYKIHGYYCFSFNSVSLKVQTEIPEIQNLADGIIPTGDSQLDAVLVKYKIDSVKTFHSSYPGFPWLTVYTGEEYNMIPAERDFEQLPQIMIAELNNSCIGDGNTIELTRNDDSAIITFSIGSGDCPAGCIYHRYWEFRVENGQARFMGVYED